MKYEVGVETGNGLRHYEIEFPELRRLILGGARIHSLRLVEDSIEIKLPEYGFSKPIKIQTGAEILKRHTRPDIE